MNVFFKQTFISGLLDSRHCSRYYSCGSCFQGVYILLLGERQTISKWRAEYISDIHKCWKINETGSMIRNEGSPGKPFWEWNFRAGTQHEERVSHKRADWSKINKYKCVIVGEF